MAQKIRNKKQLIKKRNAIISEVKTAYDEVRKKDKSLPGFYTTKAYKDLNRKRQRSFKRYDNRSEIKEQRRIAKEIKNERKGEGFNEVFDESIYESYSGKGRIFEDALIQKHKDGFLFEGVIIFNGNRKYFSNYSKFRMETNKIIAKLFDKDSDIYAPFIWRVHREYSVKEKTVLISYEFYAPENVESEAKEG